MLLAGYAPKRNMTYPEAEAHLRAKGAWATVERIAREESVPVRAIFLHMRDADSSAARRRCMAVLRWSTRWSYPTIGRIFGRDHTTVIAACRKYEAELSACG